MAKGDTYKVNGWTLYEGISTPQDEAWARGNKHDRAHGAYGENIRGNPNVIATPGWQNAGRATPVVPAAPALPPSGVSYTPAAAAGGQEVAVGAEQAKWDYKNPPIVNGQVIGPSGEPIGPAPVQPAQRPPAKNFIEASQNWAAGIVNSLMGKNPVVGYTPAGEPYYGTGNAITEWMSGINKRVTALPAEAETTMKGSVGLPGGTTPAQAQTALAGGVQKGALGNALTVTQQTPGVLRLPMYATRAISEIIKGAGVALQETGAMIVEQGLGPLAMTIQQLGGWQGYGAQGGPMSDTSVEKMGPINQWLRQNAPQLSALVDVIQAPELSTRVFLHAIQNPMPIKEKWDLLQTNIGAGRIAYTAAWAPERVEDFKRRVAANEDPYLLSLELELPGAELLGRAALDPYWLVGIGGKAKVTQRALSEAEARYELAREFQPLVKQGVFSTEAVTRGEKLGELRFTVSEAIPGVVERLRGGLTKLADDLGISALTANGKRDFVGKEVRDFLARAVAAQGTDGAANVIDAMYKLASPVAEERLEAMSGLARMNLGSLPLSESGVRTSMLLRDGLEEAGGAEKLLQSIREAQKAEDPLSVMVNLADKILTPTVERTFPTVTEKLAAEVKAAELVAAGKEVPSHLAQLAESAKGLSPAVRTLAKWDSAASKPYQVVNRFFAAIYMGMSPGYAIRNTIQDTFVMFIDHGPDLFGESLGARRAQGAMWMGGESILPERARQAFSPVSAMQNAPAEATSFQFSDLWKHPLSWARRWSAQGEQSRAGGIVGYVIDQEMRKIMVPGKAIPRIDVLLNAGVDRTVANHIVSLITDNYGDVNKARQALTAGLARGNVESWRSVTALLDPATVESLNQYGLLDDIQRALGAATREEAVAGIQAAFKKNVYDIADNVAREATGIPRDSDLLEHATGIGRAREAGYLSDESVSITQMQWVANSKAADAYTEALPSLLRRIRDQAVVTGDPQIIAQADGIMAEVDQLLHTRWIRAKQESATLIDQAWIKTREIRQASKLRVPETVDSLWARLGFVGEKPAEIQTHQQLLNHLWDVETRPEQARYFFDAVDDFERVGQSSVERMSALTGYQPRVDELSSLANAERITEESRQFRNATIVGGRPVVAAEAAGGDIFKAVRANEVSAKEQGLRAVYNAPMPGETGVSGWGTDRYGEALTRAGGDQSKVRVAYVTEEQYKAGRSAAISADTARGNKVEESVYQYTRFDEGVEWLPGGTPPAGATRPLIPPYAEGATPTAARALHEARPALEAQEQRVIAAVENNWGRLENIATTPQGDKAIEQFLNLAQERITQGKAIAADMGSAAADFTLHNYAQRYNFDTVLGYVYPYQFWYSRTYTKWLTRIARDPVILSQYTRYRDFLAKMHPDLPDWWKYSLNTNDLPGINMKNPLFFNLEQTLNPLNGLTGVDFNDSDKRMNWWTSAIDDLGKFGPSVWTPFSLLTAAALGIAGEKEAASKWAGRLIPQTATLKAALSLATGGNIASLPGKGEYDPAVWLFSGGQEPYEERRIERALGILVQQGKITEVQADDAAEAHRGTVWDMALNLAAQTRAPWQMLAYAGGTGLKGRTQEDMQIDQFYQSYNQLWAVEPNLSPDEFRKGMEQLHQQFPFMDALLIGRKGGIERDRGFAYVVLSRIPPGQSDWVAEQAHLDPEIIDKFWEEKGHIENWNTSDRERFMAGIADLAATLDIPEDATKQEWLEAKDRYGRVEDAVRAQFSPGTSKGDPTDIWTRVNAYYEARGSTTEENARANAILEADPEIGRALDMKQAYIVNDPVLSIYYGGLSKIEGYWRGLMYDAIEKELGKDVWDQWDDYNSQESDAEKRTYWRTHPDLQRYMDIRDDWAPTIAKGIVEFADKLPDVPMALRPEQPTGIGQQELRAGLEAGRPNLPQLSWEQWQQTLGGSLSNLVADYALRGEELPQSAITRLGTIATDMGLTNGYIVLELAAQAIRR